MRIHHLIVPILLSTAAWQAAQAQAPNPGNYSAEQHEIQPTLGVRVAMRDGVHLSADIYRPRAPG